MVVEPFYKIFQFTFFRSLVLPIDFFHPHCSRGVPGVTPVLFEIFFIRVYLSFGLQLLADVFWAFLSSGDFHSFLGTFKFLVIGLFFKNIQIPGKNLVDTSLRTLGRAWFPDFHLLGRCYFLNHADGFCSLSKSNSEKYQILWLFFNRPFGRPSTFLDGGLEGRLW